MIRVACIRIAPVFLDSKKTWEKLSQHISEAALKGAQLATRGETLIHGYPIWISRTNGARFNDLHQKRAYSKYRRESIHLKKTT